MERGCDGKRERWREGVMKREERSGERREGVMSAN